MLEKKPISWIEVEIIAYEKKEGFFLYQITWLINSDLGRKPQRSCALISTSLTKFLALPAVISLTLDPSALVSAYISILLKGKSWNIYYFRIILSLKKSESKSVKRLVVIHKVKSC